MCKNLRVKQWNREPRHYVETDQCCSDDRRDDNRDGVVVSEQVSVLIQLSLSIINFLCVDHGDGNPKNQAEIC